MRLRSPSLHTLVATLLAGCGGGIYLSYEFGGDDEFGPSVALSSDVSVAAPGGTVRLSASAQDSDGIDNVAFYRDDSGEWVLLARDPSPPYAVSTRMPDDARTSVRYIARATDNVGDRGASDVVVVDISR